MTVSTKCFIVYLLAPGCHLRISYDVTLLLFFTSMIRYAFVNVIICLCITCQLPRIKKGAFLLNFQLSATALPYLQSHNSDMEEEEESSVSELTEAETVESPGEVSDDAGLLKVGYGKVSLFVRE
jgi:hypothetical protein